MNVANIEIKDEMYDLIVVSLLRHTIRALIGAWDINLPKLVISYKF